MPTKPTPEPIAPAEAVPAGLESRFKQLARSWRRENHEKLPGDTRAAAPSANIRTALPSRKPSSTGAAPPISSRNTASRITRRSTAMRMPPASSIDAEDTSVPRLNSSSSAPARSNPPATSSSTPSAPMPISPMTVAGSSPKRNTSSNTSGTSNRPSPPIPYPRSGPLHSPSLLKPQILIANRRLEHDRTH